MSEGSDIRAVKHEWLLSVLAATGLDQQDFADRMGVRPDAFNHMVKNRRAVSDDTVDLICQTFNVRFVPAGKGAKPAPSALPLAVTVDQHGEENIVVVEPKARAGYVNGLVIPPT